MIGKRHILMSKSANGAGRFGAQSGAFTLIELLVVIAIIGILASMALVVFNQVMIQAKKTQATTEIKSIEVAITDYEQAYSHPPVSTAVGQSGWTSVTYGGNYVNASGTQWPQNPLPANYVSGNADVISILMDITNYPGGSATANANHQKNTQQHSFLTAKPVSDTSSPGVGSDLNYRDPWGNPYIITIDLNDDNKCEDPFYSQAAVSGPNPAGLNGLVLQSDGNYAFHGNIMVWSMGPNGPFDHSPSTFDATKPATDPSNKNHILSWQ